MNRNELVALLTAFEQKHPVEDYCCYDWQVWPLLRVQVAYEAALNNLRSSDKIPKQSFSHKLLAWCRFQCARVLRKSKRLLPLFFQAPDKPPASVIVDDEYGNSHPASVKGSVTLFTLSGRRVELSGRLYEIYTDPIVNNLTSLGVATVVWERGARRVPRYSRSFWVDKPLHEELQKQGELTPLPEPYWFTDFAVFARHLLGRELKWEEVEKKIRCLQQSSLVFAQWLSDIETKLLISVCWYDPTVMAATLAAKRLGILSVDLQHGVHDEGHFAYSGWVKAPATGYALVPKVFWNWGEQHSQVIKEINPGFHTSIFHNGGNSWLNLQRSRLFDNEMYMQPCSFNNMLKNTKKRILVSLQSIIYYSDIIFKSIENDQHDWLWLIRFHPATNPDEVIKIKARLAAISDVHIEYEQATILPFYSLLKICNVQITGHSTCALEALAFGKASIVVSQDGADCYRSYIEKGVMTFAGNEKELIQKIAEFTPTAEQCEQAVQQDFASPLQASEALDKLLEVAGVTYQKNDKALHP